MPDKSLKEGLRVETRYDRIKVYLDDVLFYEDRAFTDEEISGITSVDSFIESLIGALERKK